MSHADPHTPKRLHGPVSFQLADIRAGRVHAISDTHFGHAGITRLAHRPGYAFDGEHDALAHEQAQFAGWKAAVAEGDFVLHFGDVAWNDKGAKRAAEENLPGEVEVVEGNHDNSSVRKSVIKHLGWRFVDPLTIEWTVERTDRKTGETVSHRRTVAITHYAIDKDALPEGWVNLHGHEHDSNHGGTDHRHKNISVEVTGYRPLPLASLLDSLVLQTVGEGHGQRDPQEAQVIEIARANRLG